MVDFSRRVFADTEINTATDFPVNPSSEEFYQVNADLTVPTGAAGAGQEFKAGDVIGWDRHITGTSGAGEWVVIGGNDGAGFISEIINLTADSAITTPSAVYRVDSANDVTLTPASSMGVTPTFFYVEAKGAGAVLIPLSNGGVLNIASGTKAGIIYDESTNDWSIFIADSGVTGSVSHFVGFYTEVDPSDAMLSNTFMDLFPLMPGVSIDFSKYNLHFEEDNSPSWKIMPGAIAVESSTLPDAILEY